MRTPSGARRRHKSQVDLPRHHVSMPTSERAYDRARQRAKQATQRLGLELRTARMAAGRSQADVAAAARISQAQVGRIERGVHTHVAFDTLVVLGAMVGLDVVGAAYPGPNVIRDAAQGRLLDRWRVVLGPEWAWRHEVLVHGDDQRAWDAVLRHRRTGASVVVEAETRIYDVQALLRRVARKRAASGDVRVILVVADTHRNRAAIAAGREMLRTEFPCPPRVALRALPNGEAPPSDALIVLGPRRGQPPGA